MQRVPSIIVEGADGHGKSTLCEKLSTDLGLELLTCGPRPRTSEQLWDFINRQHDAALQGGYVIDRVSAVSHQIYGMVLSGREFDPWVYEAFLKLSEIDVIFIHCVSSQPVHVLKDYDDPAYVAAIDTNFSLLTQLYKLHFAPLGNQVIEYDWTLPGAYEKLKGKL